MLREGNGKAETCAANLLRITRYEVPYDRIKGLPADLIDKPEEEAAAEFVEDATWNLETYEPRLGANAVVSMTHLEGGDADIMVEIARITGRS